MSGEELELIRKVFDSNYIAPVGPMVDAFEQAFCEKVGIGHAVAVSSGTAAMHLALRVLGVGPGDEVMASTLTFIGSVTPILFQGATPVFIDCDRMSWNMDPDLLADELEGCAQRGKLPKALVPTDLYGQCAEYGRIFEICGQYDVPVVADAAESLGAKYLTQRRKGAKDDAPHENMNLSELSGFARDAYLHAGVGAKAAVYSFNGNKIITTSTGGMLASDDRDLIEGARFLSQQARDPFVHYEHSTIGYNYRMSNVLAAIGLGQLGALEDRVKKRREIFDYYQSALGDLPGISFMPEAPYGKSNRWLTVVLISPDEFGADREAVRLALEADNIESRPVWKPMHKQPVFNPQIPQINADSEERASRRGAKSQRKTKFNVRVVGGAVAEDLFERGLCLPSGTAMTEADLERVVGVVKGCRG